MKYSTLKLLFSSRVFYIQGFELDQSKLNHHCVIETQSPEAFVTSKSKCLLMDLIILLLFK